MTQIQQTSVAHSYTCACSEGRGLTSHTYLILHLLGADGVALFLLLAPHLTLLLVDLARARHVVVRLAEQIRALARLQSRLVQVELHAVAVVTQVREVPASTQVLLSLMRLPW